MMIRDSEHHWGAVSRSLHWLMAILLAAQWGLGQVGHEMARSPAKLEVLTWHKSLGVLLLLLALLRLTWRLNNPSPVLPGPAPTWELRAARITHVTLYALMLAIPLSGWVMASARNVPFRVFWLLPWPDIVQPSESLGQTAGAVHAALATLLLAVLGLHVAAALRHHFILRDAVLRRMLPWNRTRD